MNHGDLAGRAEHGEIVQIKDYLDAEGHIVLPDDATLMLFLGRSIGSLGDTVAYRYLDYSGNADGHVTEFEDNVVWRAADLLGISSRDRLNLKHRVADGRLASDTTS